MSSCWISSTFKGHIKLSHITWLWAQAAVWVSKGFYSVRIGNEACNVDSQAVDDGAPLSTLPLPVVNLGQKAQEGFLGVGHIAVRGPAQELEVTHHKLAFLKLKRVKDSGEGRKSENSFMIFFSTYPIRSAFNSLHMIHTSQTPRNIILVINQSHVNYGGYVLKF